MIKSHDAQKFSILDQNELINFHKNFRILDFKPKNQ